MFLGEAGTNASHGDDNVETFFDVGGCHGDSSSYRLKSKGAARQADREKMLFRSSWMDPGRDALLLFFGGV